MSYNGSGVFNINTAGQPVITGTTISSTTFNSLTADLATGLTTALTKDGQSTPTANIGMGAFKITNLAAGTVASDAARLDQVQGGAATFITVTGTDTLTGTVVPALSAYATGNQFSFLVANTNTGAVTINVDGIGSKAITRTGTTALVAGDMVAGQAVEIIYDGTRFQLVNGNSFTNLKVSGTLGVTGVATFTAQPIVSSLTASLPVFTDASKGLVSNTMTGTGNVVMSTSPTLVTPALGTPSALVGTNITGTASGLTAGNVTTNANLTGPITSVGNTTSIASQTGTGTTFAMSASPTFTGTVGAVDITTTGNTILGNASTDTLNVGNGGLVKDASGNVGIGTASPVAKLDIRDTTAVMQLKSNTGTNAVYATINNTGGDFYIGRDNSAGGTFGTAAAYASVLYSSGAYPMVFFTNATERMRIDSTGASTFTGTGKFATTIGVGNATPSASGSGITFPATQSASSDANTLDDYEEGTWTPTLTFAGVTTGITYSTQNGSYTKVGRLVSLRAVISLSNKGSASGPAYITGVPFTPADATSAGRTTGSIYMGAGTGLANLFLQPLIISETSNKIDLNTFNGTADGNIANTNFTNTSYIVIQFSYFTT